MRKVTFAVLGALLALPACSNDRGPLSPDQSPTPTVDRETEPSATPPADRRRIATEPLGTPPTEHGPPLVSIVTPRPSVLFQAVLPPNPRIEFQGLDGSGGTTARMVRYAYRLFSEDEPEFMLWISMPDSLRRISIPHFEGWTLVDPNVTEANYTDLVIGKRYLFVVTGVDQAGEASPVFSLNVNMLQMRIAPPLAFGPRLTLFNQSFNYTYVVGGFPPDPFLFPIPWPAGVPFPLNWVATPMQGTEIDAYRWALDPFDLFDGTPRTGPDDTAHWSEWGPGTSATVDPLAPGVHRFYVEVRDNTGWISIGGVRITVEGATP